MVNIYNIPLYYLNKDVDTDFEDHLRSRGFQNINYIVPTNMNDVSINQLYDENKINIRSLIELQYGRTSYQGVSFNTINRLITHSQLWQLCIDSNFPYIIIAENDVTVNVLSETELEEIDRIINLPNSILFSPNQNTPSNIDGNSTSFYIISNGACRNLLTRLYPIDTPLEWYMIYRGIANEVNVGIAPIASNNGTVERCGQCDIPVHISSLLYKAETILLIGIIVVLGYMLAKS